MKNILMAGGIFIQLVFTSLPLYAQGPPPPPEGDPDAPVDGGLVWLAAGVAGYGIKKIYQLRKETRPAGVEKH